MFCEPFHHVAMSQSSFTHCLYLSIRSRFAPIFYAICFARVGLCMCVRVFLFLHCKCELQSKANAQMCGDTHRSIFSYKSLSFYSHFNSFIWIIYHFVIDKQLLILTDVESLSVFIFFLLKVYPSFNAFLIHLGQKSELYFFSFSYEYNLPKSILSTSVTFPLQLSPSKYILDIYRVGWGYLTQLYSFIAVKCFCANFDILWLVNVLEKADSVFLRVASISIDK